MYFSLTGDRVNAMLNTSVSMKEKNVLLLNTMVYNEIFYLSCESFYSADYKLY